MDEAEQPSGALHVRPDELQNEKVQQEEFLRAAVRFRFSSSRNGE
eukprot:COSAG06_NODE_27206_length_598_cov_0.865731_2_plen_44_part_01